MSFISTHRMTVYSMDKYWHMKNQMSSTSCCVLFHQFHNNLSSYPSHDSVLAFEPVDNQTTTRSNHLHRVVRLAVVGVVFRHPPATTTTSTTLPFHTISQLCRCMCKRVDEQQEVHVDVATCCPNPFRCGIDIYCDVMTRSRKMCDGVRREPNAGNSMRFHCVR